MREGEKMKAIYLFFMGVFLAVISYQFLNWVTALILGITFGFAFLFGERK